MKHPAWPRINTDAAMPKIKRRMSTSEAGNGVAAILRRFPTRMPLQIVSVVAALNFSPWTTVLPATSLCERGRSSCAASFLCDHACRWRFQPPILLPPLVGSVHSSYCERDLPFPCRA